MAYSNNESIHSAVRSGEFRRIYEFIHRNQLPIDINDLDENLNSPLHLIYDHVNPDVRNFQADDRLPIIELLIKCGTNVNSRNKDGMTPLHLAIAKHQIKGVKMLLENKADPNNRDFENRTAVILSILFGYCYERDGEILKMLLDYGADPNLTDKHGDTGLDVALVRHRWDYVQILLNTRAATVKNVLRTFINILFSSDVFNVIENNLKLIDYLWSYIDIVVSQIYKRVHYTISNFAYCCQAHPKNKDGRVTAFLDSMRIRGFFVDYQDSKLHKAVRKRNVMSVKALLLIEETNVNETNYFFETPLHLIFNKEHHISFQEICRLLLDAGADWRAQNLMDETPFYLAVNFRQHCLINLMLSKIAIVDILTLGYDINSLPTLKIRHTENDVALHELLVAITVGCDIVIDHWLEEEYNIIGVCPQVVTMALAKAIELNNCNIVKKLLEAGFRSDVQFPGDLFKLIRGDKIRLTCLLWEFNESISLIKLTYGTVYEYSRTSEPNVLIYLLLFYHRINEYLKRSYPDLLRLRVSLKWQNFLTAELAKCKDDLLKMKKIKLASISAFNIMTMKLDSFVKLLNDEELRDVCTKKILELQSMGELDYFYIALQYRLESAIEKNRAINNELHYFNEIFKKCFNRTDGTNCSNEAEWDILLNFNIKYLKKLALSNL